MSTIFAAESEPTVTTVTQPALLLDSLEIKGYRCFEHLIVKKLGRVNLIVGKNSVGKTALLEALGIYATRGNAGNLMQLLVTREEIPFFVDETGRRTFPKNSVYELRNLFTGHPQLNVESRESLVIGSFADKKTRVSVATTRLSAQNGVSATDYSLFENVFGAQPNGLILVSHLLSEASETEQRAEFFSFEDGRSLMITQPPPQIASCFIKSDGLDNLTLATFWDEVQLFDAEKAALKAVQLVNPDIEKIGFVASSKGRADRIPIATTHKRTQREPVRSFGEGMHRVLGLALALANCKDGLLLIDEVENGLHYSIQVDVWRMIFHTARELNIQVFATTHSYDCIQAFQKAAAQDEADDAQLIRLVRQTERIKAVIFDSDELEVVARREIEVR